MKKILFSMACTLSAISLSIDAVLSKIAIINASAEEVHFKGNGLDFTVAADSYKIFDSKHLAYMIPNTSEKTSPGWYGAVRFPTLTTNKDTFTLQLTDLGLHIFDLQNNFVSYIGHTKATSWVIQVAKDGSATVQNCLKITGIYAAQIIFKQ